MLIHAFFYCGFSHEFDDELCVLDFIYISPLEGQVLWQCTTKRNQCVTGVVRFSNQLKFVRAGHKETHKIVYIIHQRHHQYNNCVSIVRIYLQQRTNTETY